MVGRAVRVAVGMVELDKAGVTAVDELRRGFLAAGSAVDAMELAPLGVCVGKESGLAWFGSRRRRTGV